MSKVIANYCLLLFFLSSWLVVPNVTAQTVDIYVEEVQAELGGSAAVNIRVVNFSDVAGAQFSLSWDPSQLSFTGLDNLALNVNEAGNFNSEMVGEGLLGYYLADMSLEGFELSDDEILFTINFDVLLPDDSAAEINFVNEPVEMVVASTIGAAIPSDFIGGNVIVGTPSGVREVRVDDDRFTASPNPFETTTLLTFIAQRAGTADLSVYDVAGKQVFQNNFAVMAGENTLPLAADRFPSVGVYLLNITTEYGSFSRKLVFSGRR